MLLSLFYNITAFHRVYRFGLWGTAWRFVVATLVATVLLVVTLMLTVAGYLLW